jgi:hypothetical protein
MNPTGVAAYDPSSKEDLMSVAPVTLPTELDPTFQDVMLQNNPDVEETKVQETVVQSSNPTVNEVTVQATTEGQPTETTVITIQSAQEQVPVLTPAQIDLQYLAGASVAQIASETGQSIIQVDNELGIPVAPTSQPIATPVGVSESVATTVTANPLAAAIATYSDVLEVNTTGTTSQAQHATPGSALSVEM